MSAQRKPPRKFSSGESLLIQREPNKLFGFPNKLPLGNVAVYVNNQNSDLIVVVEVSLYVRSVVLGQVGRGISGFIIGQSKLATAKDALTDSDKYQANAIIFTTKDGNDDVVEAVFIDVNGVMYTKKNGNEIYVDKK